MVERPAGHDVKHGTDGPCYICGDITVSTAANPSKWPNFHPFPGGNGKWRRYCEQCVIDRLNADQSISLTYSGKA
jgi:hypothetical protein